MRTPGAAILAAVLGTGLLLATTAAAAGDVAVQLTGIDVTCTAPTFTPFSEYAIAGTKVFNRPRNGAAPQELGTIAVTVTGRALAFRMTAGITIDGTTTVPDFPVVPDPSSRDPLLRVGGKRLALSGPATVTGRTGDKATCTWKTGTFAEAEVVPVAAAAPVSAAPVAANQPGGSGVQRPAVTAGGAQTESGPPLVPLGAGALLLVGGGFVAVKLLGSAGASGTSGAPAQTARPQRFGDRAAGMIAPPVERVGGISSDPAYERTYEHAGMMARAEGRQDVLEAQSGLMDLDAAAASAAVGIVEGASEAADHGVEAIKQVTGKPGMAVAYTYTGIKSTAGSLAEGRPLGESVLGGLHDTGKAILDDKLQDGINATAAHLGGTPTVDIPDASLSSLEKLAGDAASGAAEAVQAVKNFVASEATSATTEMLEERGAAPTEGPPPRD